MIFKNEQAGLSPVIVSVNKIQSTVFVVADGFNDQLVD